MTPESVVRTMPPPKAVATQVVVAGPQEMSASRWTAGRVAGDQVVPPLVVARMMPAVSPLTAKHVVVDRHPMPSRTWRVFEVCSTKVAPLSPERAISPVYPAAKQTVVLGQVTPRRASTLLGIDDWVQ